MKRTRIHSQWSPEKPQARFGTAVSLHSHTLHSREPLDFFYRIAKHCAPVRWALRRSEARYQALHGVPLDLRRAWWTPPLAPRDAYSVECNQINSLGLAPIVSLTDHDDIDAPMSLQSMEGSRNIPISVEWTVPFRNTFFHLGVHNLPPNRARAIMGRLKAFTKRPMGSELRAIFASLHAEPGMLTVFNHPLWDETGIGTEQHRTAAVALLSQHGEHLHAIELNGLRPWRENRSAIRLAGDWAKPVISGGDRHVIEPNATLNLTNADCFAEFASEIRSGWSDVLLASHYRIPYTARVVHNILDVFRTYENHRLGWTDWPDRVFYTLHDGTVASLSQLWGNRPPFPVEVLAGF
uniref:Uncharacterized protein n=1 Tax=uncultured bacterium CSLG10 TaxID=1091576 RepID=G4WV54_9BACT|nr:hypothetical protein [uncultured bacterium CSLG10]